MTRTSHTHHLHCPVKMSLQGCKNVSRRVPNLTPQQVEQKRAIDRDNQRHCRAKNKARIRSLEAEVNELKQELRDTRAQLRKYQQKETITPDEEADPSSLSLKHPESSILTRIGDVTLEALEPQSNRWKQPAEIRFLGYRSAS